MAPQQPDTTTISVRAEADDRVDPDSALLQFVVRARAASKSGARSELDTLLRRITDALAAAGGVVDSRETSARPLTWRVQSLRSHEDYDDRGRRTGRQEVWADAAITVRDFSLLATVEAAIEAVDEADLHGVSWHVDEDNAAWRQLRADAIGAALRKGQDYAAAIGSEVLGVEQVSDVGLLAGADHGAGPGAVAVSARAYLLEASGADVGVGLDPVPQSITAAVEARLVATAGRLPAR